MTEAAKKDFAEIREYVILAIGVLFQAAKISANPPRWRGDEKQTLTDAEAFLDEWEKRNG